MPPQKYDFDVCLSFAGEQREYVAEVAEKLKNHGRRVFYDEYEQAALWGKDLYEHLDSVYRTSARYCIIFASAEYAAKVWTTHERRSAQARALQENDEYVLPVRFDETEIPGLRSTIGYLDASKLRPEQVVDLVLQKLGPQIHPEFMPANPVRLYEVLGIEDDATRRNVAEIAADLLKVLRMMSVEERRFLAFVFCQGCPTQLPKNMHIDLDLMERLTGRSAQQVLDSVRGISSLGFGIDTRDVDDHGDSLVVTWRDTNERQFYKEFARENSTAVACYIFRLGCGVDCVECTEKCVEHLDFSNLSALPADDVNIEP
jgi:hypothetical protein